MKYIQYNYKLEAKPTFVSFWHFWLLSLTATLTPFGNSVPSTTTLTYLVKIVGPYMFRRYCIKRQFLFALLQNDVSNFCIVFISVGTPNKRLCKVVFSISYTDFFFRALTTDKLCSVFYSLDVYTHTLQMKKCYLLSDQFFCGKNRFCLTVLWAKKKYTFEFIA